MQALVRVARQAGFTLFELLIVLLIMGVLATYVLVSIKGRGTPDRMKTESQRMEQLFRLASDEAQVNGLELGFRSTDQGFDFLTLQANGDWTPVADGVFRARQVPEPFFLELHVEGRLIKPVHVEPGKASASSSSGFLPAPATAAAASPDAAKSDEKDDKKFFDNAAHKKADEKIVPQVLILSTGEMSAFTLDLRLKDERTAYRLEGNEVGELTTSSIQVRK